MASTGLRRGVFLYTNPNSDSRAKKGGFAFHGCRLRFPTAIIAAGRGDTVAGSRMSETAGGARNGDASSPPAGNSGEAGNGVAEEQQHPSGAVAGEKQSGSRDAGVIDVGSAVAGSGGGGGGGSGSGGGGGGGGGGGAVGRHFHLGQGKSFSRGGGGGGGGPAGFRGNDILAI